jgi:hypothetical protein
MNWQEIGGTVAKYAPLLGAVLPIPGAEFIGKAIQQVFGPDVKDSKELIQKIEQDPDAAIKLRNIEAQEKIMLDKLLVDRLALQIQDRESARNREIIIRDKTPGYMSLIFTIGYVATLLIVILLLKFSTVNAFEEKILEVIIANLSNANMFILAYYFGSTNSR